MKLKEKNTREKLYWAIDIEPQFINIEGCSIRYIKTGKGQHLLLLHTIRTQLDYFQKIIPLLSQHFEVYVLDLPGHGLSYDALKVEYTEPYHRKSVWSFIEIMQLTNIIILGESIGATLALTLAATDERKRIEKIFASNPYDYGPPEGIKRSTSLAGILFSIIQWPLLGSIISRVNLKPLLKHVLNGGFYNKNNLPPQLLDEFYKNGNRKGSARAFTSLLKNWKSWTAAKESYKNIKVPVVLIYGDTDWSNIKEREVTGKLIPGSRTITLKNTGHFACLDNPLKISEIVITNK